MIKDKRELVTINGTSRLVRASSTGGGGRPYDNGSPLPFPAHRLGVDSAKDDLGADTLNPNYDTMMICAETQADAVSGRSTKSDFSIEDKGALNDSISEALTQTNTRQEMSDIVRQLSWHVCNSRANGFITNSQFHTQMNTIINGSLLVFELRAITDVDKLQKALKSLATLEAKLARSIHDEAAAG
ncbi:hypothetical protein [Novosphingobium sp. MBES04]|uniref:hypothetical protein n=1 Tax=Novosphingobium sp. MBES04 TaxID=1206458 RepID=UPI00057DA186|nr:hypothetical protein [Novosphingobium sp. MBES04]